ncbi:phage tail protein [Paenibacillus solisilvae]|uniref:Phage tail protein n=1 Tax=Paenibacillus solisilvae TaxID=2486751 RepID=A0ABW0VX70_9BACL
MDSYIGEIRLFAGSFAPRNWALCNGQLLSIAQNTALFSLLGTQYGGDGRVTFALPDLQGRAPLHQGEGPGLTARTVGESGGGSSVVLNINEIPAHTHVPNAQSSQGAADPTNAIWTNTAGLRGPQIYSAAPDHSMSPQAVQVSGGSQPHNNMQPYVGVNYIISLTGIYPPRQ